MNRSVSVTLIGFVFFSVACKKNVDPTAFDAGAQTAPPVVATAATPSAPEAVPSAPEPLASLTPPGPAPVQAKPKAAAPKKDLPECNDARRFCNHPAVSKDKAIEALCTKHKQACFAKGGVL